MYLVVCDGQRMPDPYKPDLDTFRPSVFWNSKREKFQKRHEEATHYRTKARAERAAVEVTLSNPVLVGCLHVETLEWAKALACRRTAPASRET